MIKLPNDQMAKWRNRRSECAKSYSKAYGTMCRRQKGSIPLVSSEIGDKLRKLWNKFCVKAENAEKVPKQY
jgi:hypothetical protein